jgi:hypothetical protein
MRQIVTAAFISMRRAAGRVWAPWCEFWFKPADPTPLAVMRILFGGMLFYTQLVWGLNLEGFFGHNGWQGDALVRTFQQGQLAWSFWWWVPDGFRLTVHIACLGVLVLYTLGVFTSVTSILAYAITISYSYRAPLANYGLDQINAIAALYLAIGPSGAVLSVDRLWRRYRAARAARQEGTVYRVPPIHFSARANLALRLIQVHLCVIYIFACHSKLQGESWWSGQAIWQAVSNLEYQSVDLTWLAWYPWLVNVLTHGTIIWEMTFWALVWRPLCRPIVLLIGVAIHLGIGAFMGMWTFGLAVIFLYVAFVPATRINAILEAVTRLFARRWRTNHADLAAGAVAQSEAPAHALGFDHPVGASLLVATPIVAIAEPTHPPGKPLDGERKDISLKRPPSAPIGSSTIPTTMPLGHRAVLVLVESRLRRQTQIQEYMVRRGFRCYVASDLHQARSFLTVVDVDAIVVTSTWFSDDDVRAFRDALISGGPALPASLFFMTGATRALSESMQDCARHRVVRTTLSLRELRLLLLEVLGTGSVLPHPNGSKLTHSSNGNGHSPKPPEVPASKHDSEADRRANLEVNSNGAQP